MDEVKTFYPIDRKAWRFWLRQNHKKERKVAIIRYKKHTGKKSPSHMELMHEAICWGWIDTTVKRIDEDKYLIHFSRRNEKSKWSDNTLRYARQMINERKISSEGLRFYLEGKKKKTHDYGIPKNPDMPEGLKQALEMNSNAKVNFDSFPPSSKKMLFRWILKGQREETKKKRISHVIQMAAENKRPFQ